MNNRREDILREAARLFREKGYERTTVRDLADAVNMQSGSLFYHFKTKEDILVEVMVDGLSSLIEKLNQELIQVSSPREKLLTLLRVHLKAVLEDAPDAMGVYLYEWRSLHPDSRQRLIAQRDAYENRITQILKEIAAVGLIPPDVKIFRLFLLGAMNWTAEWFNSNGELNAEAIAERFLTYVIREP